MCNCPRASLCGMFTSRPRRRRDSSPRNIRVADSSWSMSRGGAITSSRRILYMVDGPRWRAHEKAHNYQHYSHERVGTDRRVVGLGRGVGQRDERSQEVAVSARGLGRVADEAPRPGRAARGAPRERRTSRVVAVRVAANLPVRRLGYKGPPRLVDGEEVYGERRGKHESRALAVPVTISFVLASPALELEGDARSPTLQESAQTGVVSPRQRDFGRRPSTSPRARARRRSPCPKRAGPRPRGGLPRRRRRRTTGTPSGGSRRAF